MPAVKPVLKLISKDKPIIAAETGVRYGESTVCMLNSLNIRLIYAIDTWKAYNGIDDNSYYNQDNDEIYARFVKNISPWKDKVNIIRENSFTAHRHIPDQSLNFCFIDANHEYNYVYKDITNWLPKIKNGGILSGDDYFSREKYQGKKMVYEAVCDIFQKKDIIELGYHPPSGFPACWAVRIEDAREKRVH